MTYDDLDNGFDTVTFIVEYGVHGAHRISKREFTNELEAERMARRWSQSNSQGHYWAEITRDGATVARFNLPKPSPKGVGNTTGYGGHLTEGGW